VVVEYKAETPLAVAPVWRAHSRARSPEGHRSPCLQGQAHVFPPPTLGGPNDALCGVAALHQPAARSRGRTCHGVEAGQQLDAQFARLKERSRSCCSKTESISRPWGC